MAARKTTSGSQGEPVPSEATTVLGECRGPIVVSPVGVVAALEPTSHARAATAGGVSEDAPRLFLSVEQMHSGPSPGSYDVFLLPAEADAASTEGDFAGRLSLYGPRAPLSAPGAPGAPLSGPSSGFHFVLDISAVAEALQARGAWDAERVRVRILPVQPSASQARVGLLRLLRG